MSVSVDPGNITAMRHGLDISPAGEWGRPDEIAELATLAEDHGWDGVFCAGSSPDRSGRDAGAVPAFAARQPLLTSNGCHPTTVALE